MLCGPIRFRGFFISCRRLVRGSFSQTYVGAWFFCGAAFFYWVPVFISISVFVSGLHGCLSCGGKFFGIGLSVFRYLPDDDVPVTTARGWVLFGLLLWGSFFSIFRMILPHFVRIDLRVS